MEELQTPERQPNGERRLTTEEKFKIIFPQTNYNELPWWDPRNIPWLAAHITGLHLDNFERGVQYFRSQETNEEMTQIVPFTPDKIRAWGLTRNFIPTQKRFHRFQFDDILKPEETIGGALELSIWEACGATVRNYLEEKHPDIVSQMQQADAKLKKMYLIGVYDRTTNRPTRVIYHIEGDQTKGKRYKLQEPIPTLTPAEQTI